jgi:hypothetical protein
LQQPHRQLTQQQMHQQKKKRKKNLKTKKQPWKDYHPYSAKRLYFFNLILNLFLLILITHGIVFVSVDRIFFYF